ncbi:bifunctional homocysteine S-methyltransferase/methylenetetrahydrofolate reductase [Paenibacillus gallinarum]|uniref:Bifunctional homocysteine S-methyltransferase/methylenetetrahydrofolate reductase n=1 Tax=Paenibacillus gallinarum TaxID=2762232 RepID=A0ABR8SWZ8_9BACL|nr:bifunctional homocysteine S-methyltransferase/methylenetetrahydrofolate reductase [Paenibacillus gallinarum]MBD7967843.1 bifunctional homocysteine S-methyltransferase/methylenetetrahydrofolate reductase [Paenibacillus gallinarum]
MRVDLRGALQKEILIGDGAIGTYLYQKGFPVGISYEELNLESSDVIHDVHMKYIDAGAQLIETNTYSANYDKLSKFGLEDKVVDINRAGVRIAKEALNGKGYVVGAVGSIRAGKRSDISKNKLGYYFEEQVTALIDEGVDGIMLETFYDVEELLIALRSIRKQSELPVICQFAIDDIGRTLDGYTMPQAFSILHGEGADVIGFNCRSGPNAIMRAMETVSTIGIPMSVYPNAGIADYIDGEVRFGASAEYFGQTAVRFADLNARIIGGCCGTTPEHIKAIAEALAAYKPALLPPLDEEALFTHDEIRSSFASTDQYEKTRTEPTIVDLVKERHTVIVELDPPRDLDIEKFLKGAKCLKEAGVDALTLADNSLAVTRMSNMALGYLVKEQTGMRPLIHIACRDRNLIGTQSHLMGFDALGIDHVLAVTGDPARFGDLPGASSVYDMTSFEIIRMIKQLNDGIAFSGKPLKQKADFVVGAAFNPNVKYLEKAVQRLEKKIAAGADYIMTQPVYDKDLIIALKEATKHLEIPIFIGIMPLASGRNAEYLHNEVPGILLSDAVRERMAGLEGEEGRAMGTAIAKELIEVAMEHFNGIYIMTPFMFYGMSEELTKFVWEKSSHIMEKKGSPAIIN